MQNSVFSQFMVVLACLSFLTGAAFITPSQKQLVNASGSQTAQEGNPKEECASDEELDQVTQSCVLKLSSQEAGNLDTVISGGISDEDLATRLTADENKPRVSPDSPEELKRKEAEFAQKAKVVKAADQDLVSKATGLSAYIVIPKIKVSAPIVYTTGFDIQTSDWACLGARCPMRAKLAKGVLHIAGYPDPGQKGNSLIVGHSSAYASEEGNYKTIFATINNLSAGDVFEVRLSNGKVLKYKVFRSFEFKLSNAISASPSAESTAAAEMRNDRFADKSVITLETCWPLGTNKDRWIVQGELI